MRMRKTIDNIAQVVRMNFNKNSTTKFNLDIKNNVFIPPRHDKGLKNIQSLFVAKVCFLHRYIIVISGFPCFAFQDQENSLSFLSTWILGLSLSLFYDLLPLQHQRPTFN